MQRVSLLLSTATALTLMMGACSQADQTEQPATTTTTVETPVERAADMPAGTTIKGEDGSKIKKQADGDIKIKDANGNKVKRDADDGTVKIK